MSRSSYAGPKLPKTLLDQVSGGRVSKSRNEPSRKDRRQQERALKSQRRAQGRSDRREQLEDVAEARSSHQVDPNKSHKDVRPAKSILKKTAPKSSVATRNDDLGEFDLNEDESLEEGGLDLGEDSEDADDDAFSDGLESAVLPREVSKSARARLDDDDAEIARLEKKLGIKKSSKGVRDDELDWLVNGSDSEADPRDAEPKRKRDVEDDEWLRNKRRKAKGEAGSTSATGKKRALAESGDGETDDEDLLGVADTGSSEDEFHDFEDGDDEDLEPGDDDDFVDFSDDDSPVRDPEPRRVRENPYVAPISAESTSGKYIPPSMRKPSSADEEILKQLRRQVQGQLNRLSEANILSILQSVEQIYASNARQHVTTILIELLGARIADAATLNDTFLILHAAFSTAVYRVIGPDFIAQFVEDLVRRLDSFLLSATSENGGKQTLNILAFLSYLYIFQAIGCEIVFDYIRLLLDNFSENGTELLLRMIRSCGTQLRQDDPSALKDIVLLLQRSIAKVGGESKVSVRTKFMIETIMDLKNNRMKHGIGASALAAEHVKGMKKTLGQLSSNSRYAKNNEPLRIGLKDLRDSEKKGKWWLVGASWRDPAKMADQETQSPKEVKRTATKGDDADSDNEKAADLLALARAQGMNTDVRRAIFVALMDSVSYQHAHERILKLNLKNKQTLEIPRVILRCAAAEQTYNHFYTLVACEFSADHRLRKAWEFSLLDLYRRMGESDDGLKSDDEEDGDTNEKLSVREAYNLAKLYGRLVAEGLLRVTIFKSLEFASPTGLQPTTKVFVNVSISTVILALKAKSKKTNVPADSDPEVGIFESMVRATFAHAHTIPDVALGLQFHLAKSFAKSEVAAMTKDKKELKTVMKGLEYAKFALEHGENRTQGISVDETRDLEADP